MFIQKNETAHLTRVESWGLEERGCVRPPPQDSVPQLGGEPATLSLPPHRLYMYEFRGKTGFHAPFHRQAAGPGVKCSI